MALPILRQFRPGFGQGHIFLVVLAYGQLTTFLPDPWRRSSYDHQTILAHALTGAVILGHDEYGACALCRVSGSNAWLVLRKLGINPFTRGTHVSSCFKIPIK